jgi:YhcH/YjgK/YiaL family protein
MKKTEILIVIILSVLLIQSCKTKTPADPALWNDEQINEWFESKEYLNGLSIVPDQSTDKREFAIAYFKNQDRWDKAFHYLKTADLHSLEVGRHEIDGDNVFALRADYMSKEKHEVPFEIHKKYVDLQYLISGIEIMSITSEINKAEIIMPYDETIDKEFLAIDESPHYVATPEKFFLFFPSDLHRTDIKLFENSPVKKIVVKIKL